MRDPRAPHARPVCPCSPDDLYVHSRAIGTFTFCLQDDDWGFKVCYDTNGCLLGAKADDMVSRPTANSVALVHSRLYVSGWELTLFSPFAGVGRVARSYKRHAGWRHPRLFLSVIWVDKESFIATFLLFAASLFISSSPFASETMQAGCAATQRAQKSLSSMRQSKDRDLSSDHNLVMSREAERPLQLAQGRCEERCAWTWHTLPPKGRAA